MPLPIRPLAARVRPARIAPALAHSSRLFVAILVAACGSNAGDGGTPIPADNGTAFDGGAAAAVDAARDLEAATASIDGRTGAGAGDAAGSSGELPDGRVLDGSSAAGDGSASSGNGADDGASSGSAADSGAADGGALDGSMADASESDAADAAMPDATPTMAFVTRKGVDFDEAGKRYLFVGTNFWQGMNLGAASAPGDQARLTRELDRLQALGITNLRVLAASLGPDTEPYRVVPSLETQPGMYNEGVFRGLDFLLDELGKRGMRAVMILNNYWEWSGGMAQYVSWAENSKIPYRLAAGGSYTAFVQYVDKFYGCAACQTAYRADIAALVHRVNTFNGRVYHDDPVIFSWEIANEPRDYPSNWINGIAQYIKSLDSNHMVTVGSEGSWGADFVSTHQSQYVDYTTCHIWVENWSKYNPSDSSGTSLASATTFALGYLKDHDTAARQLGKPLVLEEFGLARDGWTAGGKYDPAATVTHRDRYYQSLYDAVTASMTAGQGALGGDDFWAWAGEARPPSKWVGDPPHETAGWYSVYDTDRSTTTLISSHASAVRALEK